MDKKNCYETNPLAAIPGSSNKSKSASKLVLNPEETLRDTLRKLLNEGNKKPPETDPETFKAALDAVRFEHQRLQNEFMTLMIVNEHVQQKLDSLSDSNLKLEVELNLQES